MNANLQIPELPALPRHPALRIAELPGKGRGVIAVAPIRNGELLEVVPVIRLLPADSPSPGATLFDYTFRWFEPPFDEALALGMLSLCNHSPAANADFETDAGSRTIRLTAISDIAAGEEVTIDYIIPLWFEAKP